MKKVLPRSILTAASQWARPSSISNARTKESYRQAIGALRSAQTLATGVPSDCGESKSLEDRISTLATVKQAQLSNLQKQYSSVPLGDITVNSILNGMKRSKSLLCETSQLDPEVGIRYRGHSINHLLEILPIREGCEFPASEGLLYLLFTGDLPTLDHVDLVQRELQKRSSVPAHVTKVIECLPPDTHPMTQLALGVAACQTESVFAAKYRDGAAKAEQWKHCLEDALGLIAKVPVIAARIYRRTFKDGIYIEPREDLDW
eukprot:Selendium_serpulae@DN5956_c4_g1_i7.p2